MNLTLLINRWEEKKKSRSVIEQAVFNECISDLKMTISGELRPEHRLDTICHFKKHKGKLWEQVIREDPNYVDWCLDNVSGFQLDEVAHAYLVERQNTYHDEQPFSDHYDDLKRQ